MGQIEVKDLASLGHLKMVDALEEVQRGLAEDRLLRCVLNRAFVDPVLRKKLLRTFAALSSGAVIPPVESSRGWLHGSSLCDLASLGSGRRRPGPHRFRNQRSFAPPGGDSTRRSFPSNMNERTWSLPTKGTDELPSTWCVTVCADRSNV